MVLSFMLFPDNNLSAFFILSTVNIKCSSVLEVDEMSILILEDLPPIRVGAGDSHLFGSSVTCDVP